MEKTLNYPFERRSDSFMEWLHNTIKSENYFKTDAVIMEDEPLCLSAY